jgi:hypothetical protein
MRSKPEFGAFVGNFVVNFVANFIANFIPNFVHNRLFCAVEPYQFAIKVCDKGVKMIF